MLITRYVPESDNIMVSSLAAPSAWALTELSYGYIESDIDQNGLNDLDEGNWREFYEGIFDNVSSFANLTFVEKPADQAILRQFLNYNLGSYSGMPHPGAEYAETTVSIGGSVAGASEIVIQGRFSEYWYHEVGHSLGLLHTFDYSDRIDTNVNDPYAPGDHFLNSDLYSVMTYLNFVWGEDNPFTSEVDIGKTLLNASVGSFMPVDIAALQYLYGAVANETGDNRYVFSDDLVTNKGFTTIWDTGGTDTIVYAGESRAKIDLRAATLEHEIGGGGFLSTSETLTGGFLVANGVTIENASGASNDDLLIGNGVANQLNGNAGNDILRGLAGKDTLRGSAGSDILSGGAGVDTLIGGADTDVFFYGVGDTGNDSIVDLGAEDLFVTTTALRDGNGDGVIKFGRNEALNLAKSAIVIRDEDGARVKALELDGSFEQDGQTYYVYSHVGSDIGVAAASGFDYTLIGG